MRFLARLTLTFGLLCGASVCAWAQSTPAAIGTGTITGRVTVGDKPAPNVTVMLMPGGVYGPERKPTSRAMTDADGQFRLTNVAAGRYEIMPVAPVYVAPGGQTGFRNQGQSINLNEGETVEKIDFALVRGGVITGRVTDAEARPVIGESVRLAPAGQSNDQRGQWGQFYFSPFLFQTDDRGVYRIYGIPPGRYVVSVGEDAKSGMVRMGRAGFFTRTFHPNATEESRAAVLEVAEGSETTNVDISLGRRADTFSASGQVVDAETGKPVANVTMGYGTLREGEKQMFSIGLSTRTDAEGRFRLEGLLPGRYAAFTFTDGQSETYNVPAPFEITDTDVAGLIVKVRPAASINGVAVIEGASDRSVLAKLSQLRIAYWPETEALGVPIMGEGIKINADGQFRIGGLRPGKVRLMLGGWPPPKGFSLLRVERDGVEQRAGIVDVPAGGQVTGVRFIIEYGTGVVRGQVRVENGVLPEGARLYISARRPSAAEPSLPGAEVDARGRFVMEGLPPGEYQLRLGGHAPNGVRIPNVTQNVQATNGVETEVTLVLDLNAKGEKDKQ